MTKSGVLLINLGTPDAATTPAVRRYLREFLSDPRVLDLPAPARAALLNLVILPTRPAQSAAAYRKVWGPDGSPLMVFSTALCERLQQRLTGVPLRLAMRYGKPALSRAIRELVEEGADHLVVVPLYPQYASSSTGSTLQAVYEYCAQQWNTPYVSVIPPFFDHPSFLQAFAAIGQPLLEEWQPDHILFSYHGLPERQIQKSDPSGEYCLASETCCDVLQSRNRNCYRAQCFATTRGLLKRLDWAADRATTTFQSRLGRTPWIRPHTDRVLVQLAEQGVKKLAVYCPSFVADCLETLEEIAIRANHDFRQAGGESLYLVPSLNASEVWVNALHELIQPALRSS